MVGVYRTTLKGRPVSIQATRASSLLRTIGVLAAIEHRPHVLLRRRGRGRERHISIALLLRWVCGTPFEGHQVLLLISRNISPSFLSSQSITFSSLLFQAMLKLSKDYNERVQEEEGKTAEELIVANVGKIDPKRHLESDVAALMASNIVQCLGAMLDTIVF